MSSVFCWSVNILWASHCSNISALSWRQLLPLITSGPRSFGKLQHAGRVLIFPRTDTKARVIRPESCCLNGHACLQKIFPHRGRICRGTSSLCRHFLVYGNKRKCFIAFLWALTRPQRPIGSRGVWHPRRRAGGETALDVYNHFLLLLLFLRFISMGEIFVL